MSPKPVTCKHMYATIYFLFPAANCRRKNNAKELTILLSVIQSIIQQFISKVTSGCCETIHFNPTVKHWKLSFFFEIGRGRPMISFSMTLKKAEFGIGK